jgi:hypothetical protein
MKYVAKVGGFTLQRPPSGIGFGAKFEFFFKRGRFQLLIVSSDGGWDDHLHIDETQRKKSPEISVNFFEKFPKMPATPSANFPQKCSPPKKCRQLNKKKSPVTEIAHVSTKLKCGARQIAPRRIPLHRIRFRPNPSDIAAELKQKIFKRSASDYSNVIKRPINIYLTTLASAHNQIHSFSYQFQFPKIFFR